MSNGIFDISGNVSCISGLKGAQYTNVDNCINATSGENTLIVLGDILDCKLNNIVHLETLIDKKTEFSNNVILIAGRNDVRRLRMGRDLHIVKIDGSSLYAEFNAFLSIDDIKNLAKDIAENFGSKYKFLYTSSELNNKFLSTKGSTSENTVKNITLMQKKYWNPPVSLSNDSDTLEKRVKELYCNIDTNVTTTRNIFDDVDLIDINQKCAYICLLSMLMGNNWNITNSNNVGARLNALYLKYLKHCLILAKINHNNKKYVVSHYILPKTLYQLGFSEEVKIKLAIAIRKAAVLNEMINNINDDFLRTIESYNNHIINANTNLGDMYDLLINTTDKLTMISEPYYYGSECSPLVTNEKYTEQLIGGLDENGFAQFQNNEKTKGVLTYAILPGDIDVNICYDKPQGIVPSVKNKKNQESYTCVIMNVSAPYGEFVDNNVYAIYTLHDNTIRGEFKIENMINNNRKYTVKFLKNGRLIDENKTVAYTMDIFTKFIVFDGAEYIITREIKNKSDSKVDYLRDVECITNDITTHGIVYFITPKPIPRVVQKPVTQQVAEKPTKKGFWGGDSKKIKYRII